MVEMKRKAMKKEERKNERHNDNVIISLTRVDRQCGCRWTRLHERHFLPARHAVLGTCTRRVEVVLVGRWAVDSYGIT